MLDRRSQGLLTLHGCIVTAALPSLFWLQAFVGGEILGFYDYQLINMPLYLMGISACGLIYFNFYSALTGNLVDRQSVKVFQVTNLQSLALLTMIFGIIFATKDKGISRVFVGFYLLLSYGLLFFLNSTMPRVFARLFFRGDNLRRCMVIGSSTSYEKLADWIVDRKNIGLDLVGLVAPDKKKFEEKPEYYLGDASNLADLVRSHFINQIVLLETKQSKDWVRGVMEVAEEQGCQVLIYNPWAEYFDTPLNSVKDGPHTFFVPREEPLESPVNRLMKRVLDIAVSLPVVLLILPPMILWVRHHQRKESPGPIFFRQDRRGYNRTVFTIFKFRSMGVHNDDEARQATENDDRIFEFGGFIRRTSIDEFPQFWNVLKGEMSLVGPRPHIPEHDQLFGKEVRIYPHRHFVKPGMTGLAQVNGFRGEITDRERLTQRVNYDLEYIGEWSIWLDVIIVFRTILIVLRPPPTAY
ncbi:MAG: exopolysaccharide biosynthesis polyprenyl glycosylphosphotransferase [Verrucomicrobiota bacterium]